MPDWSSVLRQRYYDEALEVLGDKDLGVEVVRQGARRPRAEIGSVFHPYMTERQRTVLKGKARQGRWWGRILQTMEDTGMTMEEFVATLSNEELARGQVKDKNGEFRGRPPQWVPRAFHRACISELMKRGQELWRTSYVEAIKAMTSIAVNKGGGATPGEQIKAAQFVIERLEGKVPEKLIVEADAPWMAIMDGIVADVPDAAIERGKKLLASAERLPQDHFNFGDDGDAVDAEVVEDYEPAPPAPVRSQRGRRTRR